MNLRTNNELAAVAGIKEKLSRLKSYLKGIEFDDELSESQLAKHLHEVKMLQGNINNDVSLLAALSAKDYLLSRFELLSSDFVEKPQGAPGLDIDVMTQDRQRIVAEVKTTVPYSGVKNDLGSQQRTTFAKDFSKLNSVNADRKFFFVTDNKTYSIVTQKYKDQIPSVEVVLLQVFGE